MAAISSNTMINQPIDKVFNYVVAVENHKAWQAGIQDARLNPPGPVQVGSVYVYTSQVMGRKMETQMQVTALIPNQKWAIKTVGIPNSVETVYQFVSTGSGTQLTISMDVPPGAYPAAAEGMIKQQMQKSLVEQGAKVKQMVGG
ncbi:MAG: SRPBCC family protein [Anaerolineales bacterium]|nr:SRPBCC family protein [Anaerolineales bacterium]